MFVFGFWISTGWLSGLFLELRLPTSRPAVIKICMFTCTLKAWHEPFTRGYARGGPHLDYLHDLTVMWIPATTRFCCQHDECGSQGAHFYSWGSKGLPVHQFFIMWRNDIPLKSVFVCIVLIITKHFEVVFWQLSHLFSCIETYF